MGRHISQLVATPAADSMTQTFGPKPGVLFRVLHRPFDLLILCEPTPPRRQRAIRSQVMAAGHARKPTAVGQSDTKFGLRPLGFRVPAGRQHNERQQHGSHHKKYCIRYIFMYTKVVYFDCAGKHARTDHGSDQPEAG